MMSRVTQLEQDLKDALARLDKALARVDHLEAKVTRLEQENARLKERLNKNSKNSSKPPSSDTRKAKHESNKPTGLKRGAQPGHTRHERQSVPIHQVDHVVELAPTNCKACNGALQGSDENPIVHQVVEVPPIKPTVTEYRLHALICSSCQTKTRSTPPDEVSSSCFGPRLSAMMAVCTGKYRMSKRNTKDLLSDFVGVTLCIGSVSKTEKRVSAALEAPYQEAADHVRQQPVVHADETGWRENKEKAWLWVAATHLVAVFAIATSRGALAAQRILGAAFSGILVTDRWPAYNWVATDRRQLCWAHLIRDFQSWVDRENAGTFYGNQLLRHTHLMFSLWHRLQNEELSRHQFKKQMGPIRAKILSSLNRASLCGCQQTAGMATHMLSLQAALWTFVDQEGVEPTNNFAERTIRHAVIWRKTSFGTDALCGSHFVERMLTTVASIRQQNRNVLEFITEALRAHASSAPVPSLLPGRRAPISAAA